MRRRVTCLPPWVRASSAGEGQPRAAIGVMSHGRPSPFRTRKRGRLNSSCLFLCYASETPIQYTFLTEVQASSRGNALRLLVTHPSSPNALPWRRPSGRAKTLCHRPRGTVNRGLKRRRPAEEPWFSNRT
ncbi:hypothetical protein SKAU_G00296700 [Synaphobranchus kaupii]|uniref:Uncharacterized protein n=1 Tax=Synaphobranchus kaupii TaxID=118154 RepID=A0A9Q1ILW5_SYNKA|nr:hypothetical protein SKAU_G00296700 [Synaphobranchus kaupii]